MGLPSGQGAACLNRVAAKSATAVHEEKAAEEILAAL